MGRFLAVGIFLLAVGVVFALLVRQSEIISPVTKVRGSTKKIDFVKNTWFPKSVDKATNFNLNLTAKSAIAVDYETGNVLYFKNPKEKLPVASTVKIMSSLVALENKGSIEVFLVSEKAASTGENSMGLTAGEELPMKELIYGMMLVSGNDAAVAVSEGVSGSEEAFVANMNMRAKEIGANDTKFINASGLDIDGRSQYSTAYDMAIISHYVWENYPEFRQISETYNHTFQENPKHKAYNLYNDTNLLTTYPGVKGIKPGFTWEAGMCLATYAENDGRKILAVVLASEDRRGEMVELLDYSFAELGVHVEHPALDL